MKPPLSIVSQETQQVVKAYSGSSIPRVVDGTYVHFDLRFNAFKLCDPQQWIGTTASGEVQHMSGSYSAVVVGTDLRFVNLFAFPM